jgi:hypothetical protein
MHCPTCRTDNAPTTRFCTSCGAVLVEEAPGGGRRRVLRPWGLRGSAPPTISPDLGDLAPLPRLKASRAWRTDLWLVSGVVAVLALGTALHPWLSRTAASPTSRGEERVVAAPTAVSTPVSASVKETRLVAPALVERSLDDARKVAGKPVPAALPPLPESMRSGGARAGAAVQVAFAAPARELVVGDGQSADPPVAPVAEPAVAPAPDHLQALRADLDSCRPLGVLDRAVCEQRARIGHCDSYWGHVPDCPQWRNEVR